MKINWLAVMLLTGSMLVGCNNVEEPVEEPVEQQEEVAVEEPQQEEPKQQEPTRIVDDYGHEYLLEWNGYKFEGKEYEGIGVRGVSVEAHADSATQIVEAFKNCEYELYRIGGANVIQLADAVLLYEGNRNSWVEDVEKDPQTHIAGMLGIAMISSILTDVNISVVGTDGFEIYSYQNGEEGVSVTKWADAKQLERITKAMENVDFEN